jgi:DNA-binding response OmpR family regulator
MADVLIVEDDPVIRHALLSLLQDEGHAATAVATGRAAVQAASHRAPQLVLMDVGLPDGDGIEFAAELRRMPLPCPLIFLTARGGADFVARALSCDPHAYLVKPISGEQLVPIVRTALHAAQMEQAREDKLLAALADSREISAAVGMLAERHRWSVDEAFAALRLMARSKGRRIVDVSAEITRRSR